jgi:hypothetical protein
MAAAWSQTPHSLQHKIYACVQISYNQCPAEDARDEGTCVSGLLVNIFHHMEYQRGWRQQGRYVKSKLQKTASFTVLKSIDVHQSTRVRARAHAHTHTHTYTNMRTHTRTNAHKLKHTLTHAHTHTHTHTHMHTHARTHTHTHSRAHAHTHARTHTHTHLHPAPALIYSERLQWKMFLFFL